MKPHFHKVPVKLDNSFSLRHDSKPNFGTVWHYHPELELHYIIKGQGVQFIGDNISNFSAGDMILLGENLPHTWRCKEEYFLEGSVLEVEAYALHFLPACLGRDFLNLPEAFLIPKLFEKAKRGLIIKGKAKAELANLLEQATHVTDLDRLILFLSILKILAAAEETETITSAYPFNQSNEAEMERLEKIYSYTLENYKNDISLEEIASIANMSGTSFCRYFKLMTKKTFFEFLTEIRISHVCRGLIENKFPTEVICLEYGFKNISNFYRHFKKVTKLTPFEYKKKYLHQPIS
ncbi:MAG TPA: AraC family transcriptional regulator [Flavitalea sp.]|nr:AraC family transcriptional regulator [Flavitalea sp.]